MVSAAIALGTGAATSAAHRYTLQVAGLDVAKSAGSPGSLFGADPQSMVLAEDYGKPASLEFSIDDPLKALSPREGDPVYLADHEGRRYAAGGLLTEDLFRGIVETADRDLVGLGWRHRIKALSLEVLFDRRVLTSGVIPSTMRVRDAIQQVAGAVDERISVLRSDPEALFVGRPGIGQSLICNGGGSDTVNVDVPMAGKTVRRVLEDVTAGLATVAGVEPGFEALDVDMQGRVRFLHFEAVTPYATIAEAPAVLTGRAVPERFTSERDVQGHVNAVYVQGVDDASSGWVEDLEAIALYGRRETYHYAPEALNSTARDNIGNEILRARAVQVRASFELDSDCDNLVPNPGSNQFGGWHIRNRTTLSSNSGYPLPSSTPLVKGVRRTWQSGDHSTIELSYGGRQAASGAALLASRIVDADRQSRSANRLRGTLDETAIRVKAGVPTDADFDIPRDGFLVVDSTSPGTLYARIGGVWTPLGGSVFTPYTPAVGNGGAVTWNAQTGFYFRVGKMVYVLIYLVVNAAGSGAGIVSIDTPTAPDRATRQALHAHTEGIGAIGSGSLVALVGGAGATWDRLRVPLNNATNQDENVTGAALLATGIIVVSGWYREA